MSLIHLAVARSRFPACLALLAMLLLFIAPVISKSLMAQHDHASMMMMMPVSATMDVPTADRAGHQHACAPHPHSPAATHAHHPVAQPSAAAPSANVTWPKHHHMSMMDDSACGYCVLLIHLPLDSVQLPQLWTLLQAAIPAIPLQLQPYVASWIPIWFRPRGPPVNAFSFA